MKCSMCLGDLSYEEARQLEDEYLCESCYIEKATAPRSCDVLGVTSLKMHRAVTIPEDSKQE